MTVRTPKTARQRPVRGAFTLVELLVVVAIITLLLYFDGHAGFSANYITNYSDLASMGWGYFNYP